MTYDSKSYELAEYFLEDYIGRMTATDCANCAHVLAQQIQQTIEDYLKGLEDD
jgi:hypothetical protein